MIKLYIKKFYYENKKKYNCLLKIIAYINTKKGYNSYNNSIYCFSKLFVNRYKICASLHAR